MELLLGALVATTCILIGWSIGKYEDKKTLNVYEQLTDGEKSNDDI